MDTPHGLFSAVTGIAVAIGPLVGGAIAEGIDWEWIFWVNVPIGLAAVPLVLSRIEESYGADTGLDPPGWRWSVPPPSASSGGSCVETPPAGAAWRSSAHSPRVCCWWVFVARELRAREPMLPMRLFRSRAFYAGNAAISSHSPRSSAPSSSSHRCCRRASGTAPSTPGSG